MNLKRISIRYSPRAKQTIRYQSSKVTKFLMARLSLEEDHYLRLIKWSLVSRWRTRGQLWCSKKIWIYNNSYTQKIKIRPQTIKIAKRQTIKCQKHETVKDLKACWAIQTQSMTCKVLEKIKGIIINKCRLWMPSITNKYLASPKCPQWQKLRNKTYTNLKEKYLSIQVIGLLNFSLLSSNQPISEAKLSRDQSSSLKLVSMPKSRIRSLFQESLEK